MIANYNMIVDFARPSKTNTIIVAENDAESRNCNFKLLFDKAPFDMTGVTQAIVKGILSDGSIVYGEATIKRDDEDNPLPEVSYLLPLAITQTAGNATMTIELDDNLGGRITSFEWYVKVRNALYDEDDYIDEDDLEGFRDLLARSRAALERMEQMVQQDALPNPYPLRISVDNVDYEYNGEGVVEILMEEVAYLGEVTGEVEITEDDSAAQVAVNAAAEAAQSVLDCDEKLTDITNIIENFESKIPTATVSKDTTTHISTITITDQHGVTSAEVVDGVIGSEWYEGTDLTGTTTGQTGVAGLEGDYYVNPQSKNVYKCVSSGDSTTAVWDWLLTMDGGNTYDAGTGIDITSGVISIDFDDSITQSGAKPVTGSTLYGAFADKADVSDLNNYYTKTAIDDKLKVVVTYGGTKTFNDLTSSLLIADNVNKFFLLTSGGYITSSNVGNWTSSYVVGDHVMVDSHIAVVNVGTEENPDYRFDDFGGFVEVDEYTSLASPVSGVVTFTNLNSNYGYQLNGEIPDESSSTLPTSLSDVATPTYTRVQRSTNADGTINLAYTVTNTSIQYALRIFK